MAFNLAEAFISLTQRGFDTSIASVDGVEQSLHLMQQAGITAGDTFEGSLVEAIAAAAGELTTFQDASEQAKRRLEAATETVNKLSSTIGEVKALEIEVKDKNLASVIDQLAELQNVVGELDEVEVEFLGSLEEKLSALVEDAKRLNVFEEAFKKADDAAKPPKKSIKELNAEIAKAKEEAAKFKFDPDTTNGRDR